jgi:ribosome-associated protein
MNISASKDLAREIARILIEKKAIDVKLFDVSLDSSITDYFVNATGRSSTNVRALTDDVLDKLEEYGKEALRVEGREGNSWLLIDYGDVIVNVFDKQSREFYNFDRLLPESGELDLSDIIKEIDNKYDVNNTKED